MSLFLKIDSIKGNVTTDEHKDWMQIESVQITSSQSSRMQVGKMNDRQHTTPTFSEIHVTKNIDAATPYLFSESHSGKVFKEAKIESSRKDENNKPFIQFILNDVIISSYKYNDDGIDVPAEQITLSYSKIEITYSDIDEEGNASSPVRVGFNLEQAKKL